MVYVKAHETLLDSTIHHFQIVRRQTEYLCRPLTTEDFMVASTNDTSPPKWHLAHTSWFWENFILKKMIKGYEPYKDEYHFIFNSYYRRVGPFLNKSKRNILSRPTIREVMEYRRVVTDLVLDELSQLSYQEFKDILPVLEIAINHEEQHQELLMMDIKRNFYENPLRPKYNSDHSHGAYETPSPDWLNIPSGLHHIGVDKNSLGFAFDNEKDRHKEWIESCMISSHLVTNEDYITFIEEGGYDNPLLWASDGWELKEKEKWMAPLYWEKDGGQWWAFTLGGMMLIDPAAPVSHVSFYEALAYAKWKGARLPTEAEWEVAGSMEKSECTFLESGHYEPEPPITDHQYFSQIHGAVWEWTQSSFHPYPRFEKFLHEMAEYNEKFMVNQYVLRGGSCVTPRAHYRPTYRNFYYPHQRWQFSGIRLAKDLA